VPEFGPIHRVHPGRLLQAALRNREFLPHILLAQSADCPGGFGRRECIEPGGIHRIHSDQVRIELLRELRGYSQPCCATFTIVDMNRNCLVFHRCRSVIEMLANDYKENETPLF
jgi:hypothetical protein